MQTKKHYGVKKVLPFLLQDLLALYKAINKNINNGVIELQYISEEIEIVQSDLTCIRHQRKVEETENETIDYILDNYLLTNK